MGGTATASHHENNCVNLRRFRAAHDALAFGNGLWLASFHGTVLRADELAHYCAALLAL